MIPHTAFGVSQAPSTFPPHPSFTISFSQFQSCERRFPILASAMSYSPPDGYFPNASQPEFRPGESRGHTYSESSPYLFNPEEIKFFQALGVYCPQGVFYTCYDRQLTIDDEMWLNHWTDSQTGHPTEYQMEYQTEHQTEHQTEYQTEHQTEYQTDIFMSELFNLVRFSSLLVASYLWH